MKKALILVLASLTVLAAFSTGAAELRAGAGRVEIVVPPGMPLAGYGDRINKPNTGVHDPVYARALVFESGGKRAGVVDADILLVTLELKLAVAERVKDLHLDFLDLTATHTHYSIGSYVDNKVADIAVMGRYDPHAFEIVADAMAQALREAAADVRPASVGAASGPSPAVTHNRRHKGGPVDPAIRVLGVWDSGGKLMAVIMNHAIHPTTMPSQTTLVTGDVAGRAEGWMEEKHPGSVAMFMNAGLGDQSPYLPGMGETWDTVTAIGDRMAEASETIIASIKPSADVDMTLYDREFQMPAVYLRRSFQCWGGLNQLFKVLGGNMMRKQGEVMGLGLNNALFLFSPGELAVEVQADLQGMFPDRTVFVAVLSNDYYGYVVTPDDYQTGGYETCMSFYGPDFATVLEEQFKAMVAGAPRM
jgi:neutral ceramidase